MNTRRHQCRACFEGSLGVFMGVVTGVLIIRAFFDLGLFRPTCPAINGQVCNGVGTCMPNGFCDCTKSVWYSGDSCTDTLIPTASGGQCSGIDRGTYNPLTLPRMVLPACRDVLPTQSNGFTRSGGWLSPECATAVAEARALGTPEAIMALPDCYCYAPYGGVACQEILCPRNVQSNQICSGYGNSSVGFMQNGTGIGCQCQSPQFLLDYYPAEYSRDSVEQILLRGGYARLFPGFCGTLLSSPTDPDIRVVVNPMYRCYCDELHTGEVCEFGVCPTNVLTDQICSNNGHPGYGFGYELNTTTRVCDVICSDGTVLCPTTGSCVSSLSLCGPPATCTGDTPVRCPDGSCKGTRLRSCDLGAGPGTYDIIDSVRSSANTSAGNESIQDSTGFRPAGYVFFDTPLVWGTFTLLEGVLELSYLNYRFLYDTPGIKYFSLNYTYDDIEALRYRAVPGTVSVFLEEGTWRVQPVPWMYSSSELYPALDAVMRLQELGRDVVIDVQSSYVYANATALWGYAQISEDLVLRPYGSIVTLETCFSDLSLCVWSQSTGISYDGARKLCLVNGELQSTSDLSCGLFSNSTLTGVSTGAMFLSRVSSIDLTSSNWTIQRRISVNTSMQLISTPSTRISGQQWIESSKLVVDCVCPSVQRNTSTWNRIWQSQLWRLPPSVPGQYFVGTYLSDGDPLLLRATYSSSSPTQIFGTAPGISGVAAFSNSRAINRSEMTTGLREYVPYVFPALCPDGTGSTTATLYTTVTATCSCVDTSCSCESPLLPPFTCSGTTCDGNGDSVLFSAYMTEFLNRTCFLTRVTGDLDPTYGQLIDNTTTEWLLLVGNDSYPGWLEEVLIPDSCNLTVQLFGQSTLFQDTYDLLTSNNTCTADGSLSILPTYDPQYSYSRYVITNTTNQPVAEWSPQGIPLSRLYTLTATQSDGTVVAGLWTSGRRREGVWYETATDLAVVIEGLFVDIRTAGLYRVQDNTTLGVRLYAQVSNTSTNWQTVDMYESTAVDTHDKHLFQFFAVAKRVRIFSYYPLSLWRFIPLTNQDCPYATLYPLSGYQPYVLSTLDFIIRRDELMDPVGSCTGTDLCFIGGVDFSANGVCNDEFGLSEGRQWFFELVELSSLTAEQVIQQCLNVTAPVRYEAVNGTAYWFIYNATLPTVPLPLTPFLVQGWSNATAVPPVLDTFCYVTINEYSQPTPDGSLVVYGNNTGFTGLVPGTYCANGTDVTDCGCSSRFARIQPGLQCALTQEQQSISDDAFNRTDFYTNESRTLSEFMGSQVAVFHGFTMPRKVLKMVRAGCGNCDGLSQCLSGECTKDACPVPRSNCPGNGCTRANPNIPVYTCACKPGTAGFTCSAGDCTPGDPETAQVPFEQWCAQGLPPLRSRPPDSQLAPRNNPSLKQVYLQNQLTGTPIVANIRVRPEFAPFGIVRGRYFVYGNRTLATTCPAAVRGPFGQPLLLDQCVDSYDLQGNPATWVQFKWPDGTTRPIIWTTPTQYDDFPYRCPNNGQCVTNPSICDLYDVIKPACSGHGTLRADGTCECFRGYRTFVFTEDYSRSISVPYFVGDDGVPNPTVWGRTNLNSLYWGDHYCAARDCEQVDCSPPQGCYVGTRAQEYRDALISCSEESGSFGMCGADLDACRQGRVEPRRVCSGNGIARLRDYRTGEWYCQCGTSASSITIGVTETTQLVSNGWGGLNCGQYLCAADPVVYWSSYNEPQNDYWRGINNEPLPGKWIGPCNSTAGPSPDDITVTRECCGEVDRLELCNRVRCQIGGKYGSITCMAAADCIGPARTPQVYACNGKGKARADGSCECEYDPSSGIGYIPDYTQYATAGCFAKITAPLSKQRSTPCNRVPPGQDFTTWIQPKVPYYEQSVWTLMALEGNPPTNRTLVLTVVKDLQTLRVVKEQAYVQSALEVLNAQQQLGACVCVYPNDDSTCCMNPGSGIKYRQPFNAPYQVPAVDPTNVLTDGLWFLKAQAKLNIDYVNVVIGFDNLNGPNVTIQLGGSFYISAIRIFGMYEFSTNGTVNLCGGTVSTGANCPQVALAFKGDGGTIVCPPLQISAQRDYTWLGPNNGYYCLPTFTPYNFRVLQRSGFLQNCQLDEESAECVAWKVKACPSPSQVRLPSSLSVFYGCMGQLDICCTPDAPPAATFTTTTLRVIPYSVSGNPIPGTVFSISEIRVFAYRPSQVVPVPPIMRQRLTDYQAGTNCTDQKFVSGALGNDGDYLVFENNTVPSLQSYLTAFDACLSFGAVFASNDGSQSGLSYAQPMGEACIKKYAPSSTTTAGIPEPGCLVAARNVNSTKNLTMSTVIDPDCFNNMAWIGIDSGDTADIPLNRGSPFDYYSAPNGGAKYQTNWLPGTVRPWTDFMARAYTEGERQMQARGNRTNVKYYPWKQVVVRPGAAWNAAGPIAQQVNDIPAAPFSPTNCDGAAYCRYQTRFRQDLMDKYAVNQFDDSYYVETDTGEAGTAEYSVFDQDAVGFIKYYSLPGCGRCNLAEPNNYQSPYVGAAQTALYTVYMTPANNFMGFYLDLLYTAPPPQDNKLRYFDECVCPLEFCPVGCGQLGTQISSNVRSLAISNQYFVQLNDFHIRPINDPEPRFTTFRGPNTGWPTFRYYNYPLQPWQINDYPYGAYPNANSGQNCAGTAYDGGLTKQQVKDSFSIFGQNMYYDMGYDKRDYGLFRSYNGGQACWTDRGFCGVIMRPLYGVPIKIKVVLRAQRYATGSNQGPFPDYVMGWETHPYGCFNVDLYWQRWVPINSQNSQFRTEWVRMSELQNEPVAYTSDRLLNEFDFGATIENPSGTLPLPSNVVSVYLQPTQTVFTPCSALNMRVPHAPTCPRRPTAVFQWDDTYFDAASPTFQVAVDSVRYDTAIPPSDIPMQIFVNQASATFASYRNPRPLYYVNRVANWVSNDFRVDFWLDECMYVRPTRRTSNDSRVPLFTYDTTTCEFAKYPALCTTDTVRYTVESGTQCDQCGTGSRTGAFARPSLNNSCVAEFPLANPAFNPIGFANLAAYQSGTLSLRISTTNYDYDFAAQFILQTNQSIIGNWPEWETKFLQQISDRPNHLSRGQTANFISWIDADVFGRFPFNCGPVTNPATGITRPLWAVTAAFCSYTNAYDGVPLAPQDYPTILNPLDPSLDPAFQPICGITIKPYLYGTWTGMGAASPMSTMILVGQFGVRGGVELESPGNNGTWYNTGKNEADLIFTANLTATITGQLVCENCLVIAWLAPLNPTYGPPGTTLPIANLTNGVFNFTITVPNDGFLYQVLGFNFTRLSLTEVVTLYPLLVTTTDTIAICLAGFPDRDFKEPPSFIEDGNAQNVFIFNKDQQIQYDAPAVGVCYCEGPAWGGDSCECPAMITRRGKGVCGNYGLALSRVPGIAFVSDAEGCYDYSACNCMDVGSAFRTIRYPLSAFDYTKINRFDTNPNQDPYTKGVATQDISLITISQQAVQVCGAVSSTLVNFPTADNVQSLLSYIAIYAVSYPIYVGLELDADDTLRWAQADIQFGASVPTDVSDPCPSSPVCGALNWNNLVYNFAGSALFNGQYSSVATASFTANLLRNTTGSGVTVYVVTSALQLCGPSCTISSNGNVCTYVSPGYRCPVPAYPTVVTATGCACGGLSEVFVFDGVSATEDLGRNPFFFT